MTEFKPLTNCYTPSKGFPRIWQQICGREIQMATVRLRDGEVTLYTRGDSKNWYAGSKLARGGRLQESLKTRNKAVARERALERHDDLKARAKYGLTQNTVTFANAADAWLLDLNKQVTAGARKQRTVIDYAPTK